MTIRDSYVERVIQTRKHSLIYLVSRIVIVMLDLQKWSEVGASPNDRLDASVPDRGSYLV